MFGLSSVILANFRSYERREYRFDREKVVFAGPNGTGKSNVLEAIGYLALLRSFRGAARSDMFRIGGDGTFALQGLLNCRDYSETLALREFSSGNKRVLCIGNSPVRRTSEFINEFRVISFAPEDRELVSGSGSRRRRFFDTLISMLDGGYFTALADYKRALEQRNCALKAGNLPIACSFDECLAEAALILVRKRLEYAETVKQEVNGLLGGKYRFDLRPQFKSPAGGMDEYRETLIAYRQRDLREGCTQIGPQRDDFEFLLDGRSLRICGSTGQHRVLSLLLKLAEFRLMRRNSRNKPVIALIDDVTGELDAANRALFYDNISQADQSFFTMVEAPQEEFFSAAQLVRTG